MFKFLITQWVQGFCLFGMQIDSEINTTLYETVWGKKALKESYKSAGVYDGMSEIITDKEKEIPTEGKPIIVRRNFVTKAGYQEYVPFVGKITGEGTSGDDTLEGNEQESHTYAFLVAIDQKRQAVREKGRMDAQKSSVKLFKFFRPQLSDWQKDYRNKQITRKLAGATTKTWSNTPTAATTNRVLYGGTGTSQGDIDSADKFDLTLVAKSTTLARNEYIAGTDSQNVPPLGGIDFGGPNRMWLDLLHPAVYFDLLETARVQQMLRESGAYQKNNPLMQGGDIVYLQTILRACEYLREADVGHFTDWGTGSDQPGARNLFLGSCACAVAESNNPRMVDDGFDYKNKRGVAIDAIWGVQKFLYNGEDVGVIAQDTYRTSGI